jgi:signal transduction histidine kinase
MPDVQLDASVLVIDDEPGIRSGCQRVLQACGARVDLAGNGAEAMAKLREADFDVAIVDLVMPDFGGLQVLDGITAADITVVPIVITAHSSIETAVDAIKHGAFDYLPKPFVPMELILRVERGVRWRRLRQEAERNLLELDTDKTRLRSIVNGLADGILIANADDQAVLFNPAAVTALNLPPWSGEPQPLSDIVRDPALLDLIHSAAQRPGDAAPPSTAQVQSAGRIYMARVVPIRSGGGDALGTATVLRDITDLMNLERAKAQFMSRVAHELKAPLAAVQGFLRVILTGQELPREKLFEIVARCSDRVEGMCQLVGDLLSLSRAGAMPTRKVQPLSLAEVVEEVADLVEQSARPAGVSLEVSIAPDCPPAHADRDELTLMLSNLVSNAVKYNRPGGKVTITACADADMLRIDVSDTGLGIPDEALPRLGEEFFRVAAPDRQGIVGTGLGLALVHHTLEGYNGRLEVKSKVGEGSTFSILLPLSGPQR